MAEGSGNNTEKPKHMLTFKNWLYFAINRLLKSFGFIEMKISQYRVPIYLPPPYTDSPIINSSMVHVSQITNQY
jgi:hypothetical protein